MIPRHLFPASPTIYCCSVHNFHVIAFIFWWQEQVLKHRVGKKNATIVQNGTQMVLTFNKSVNVYWGLNENSLSATDASWFAWAVGASSNIRHIRGVVQHGWCSSLSLVVWSEHPKFAKNVQFHLVAVLQRPVTLSRRKTSFKTATRMIFKHIVQNWHKDDLPLRLLDIMTQRTPPSRCKCCLMTYPASLLWL